MNTLKNRILNGLFFSVLILLAAGFQVGGNLCFDYAQYQTDEGR